MVSLTYLNRSRSSIISAHERPAVVNAERMLSSRRFIRWRLASPVSRIVFRHARIDQLALVVAGHVLGAAAIALEAARPDRTSDGPRSTTRCRALAARPVVSAMRTIRSWSLLRALSWKLSGRSLFSSGLSGSVSNSATSGCAEQIGSRAAELVAGVGRQVDQPALARRSPRSSRSRPARSRRGSAAGGRMSSGPTAAAVERGLGFRARTDAGRSVL